MSGVNVNISVSNLPHLNRHQDDAHHRPVINQQQNTQINNTEFLQRVAMPVQPDQVEGKIIDPENKALNNDKGKKRRKKRNCPEKPLQRSDRRDDGHFVDIHV